jgi:Na+-transporting NADH:ubiquinone oxidoreductase subunit C
MSNESVSRTLLVAGLLSVVCSALVSSSAVLLRPEQARNKDLDRKKNILQAAGVYKAQRSIADQFSRFEIKVIDLSTGKFRDDIDAATFDQRKAAKSNDQGMAIAKDSNGKLAQLILPVHGKGLWSTLYGYLALDSDLTTINGFAFYEHGETPGLGGEVDNPRWKAQWIGKQAFAEDGTAWLEVLKGKTNPDSPDAIHQIDGLAGATITSRGIDSLLRYWLGEHGFKPLLDQLKSTEGETDHG